MSECRPSSCLDPICLVTNRALSVEDDQLLTREVNLKPNYSRVLAVYGESKELPESFVGGEVSIILILANLINVFMIDRDLCHSFIWVLVDVLV